MRKVWCDVCKQEIQPDRHGQIKVHNINAYVEVENLTITGYGGADYFLKLETYESCAKYVKDIITKLMKDENIL